MASARGQAVRGADEGEGEGAAPDSDSSGRPARCVSVAPLPAAPRLWAASAPGRWSAACQRDSRADQEGVYIARRFPRSVEEDQGGAAGDHNLVPWRSTRCLQLMREKVEGVEDGGAGEQGHRSNAMPHRSQMARKGPVRRAVG
jgi:hypothetical protein